MIVQVQTNSDRIEIRYWYPGAHFYCRVFKQLALMDLESEPAEFTVPRPAVLTVESASTYIDHLAQALRIARLLDMTLKERGDFKRIEVVEANEWEEHIVMPVRFENKIVLFIPKQE